LSVKGSEQGRRVGANGWYAPGVIARLLGTRGVDEILHLYVIKAEENTAARIG